MIPALIILTLWVALLAPGVVRWLRGHRPTTSIASFHRQLRGLEHAAPKIVEPAYRLDDPGGKAMERPAPPPTSRVPRLVLLASGPTQKEPTMRYDDRYDEVPADPHDHVEEWDADPWGRPEVGYEPATKVYRTVRAPSHDDYADYDLDHDDYVAGLPPDAARVRRKRILVGLGATIAATFILGLLPSLGILWAVTFIAVMAMVVYLGLMFYASTSGLYGSDTYEAGSPVASVVIPTYRGQHARYDDDDGWDQGRIAAAR